MVKKRKKRGPKRNTWWYKQPRNPLGRFSSGDVITDLKKEQRKIERLLKELER